MAHDGGRAMHMISIQALVQSNEEASLTDRLALLQPGVSEVLIGRVQVHRATHQASHFYTLRQNLAGQDSVFFRCDTNGKNKWRNICVRGPGFDAREMGYCGLPNAPMFPAPL